MYATTNIALWNSTFSHSMLPNLTILFAPILPVGHCALHHSIYRTFWAALQTGIRHSSSLPPDSGRKLILDASSSNSISEWTNSYLGAPLNIAAVPVSHSPKIKTLYHTLLGSSPLWLTKMEARPPYPSIVIFALLYLVLRSRNTCCCQRNNAPLFCKCCHLG
jgi:hypothetical protein